MDVNRSSNESRSMESTFDNEMELKDEFVTYIKAGTRGGKVNYS